MIITGAEAFAEDSWHTIQIGEVVFELVKPCSRCILTTVNIDDGSQHPTGEPLTTLQSFRTDEHGEIDFGQNAIAKNSVLIRVGDTVIGREIFKRETCDKCGSTWDKLDLSGTSQRD